MLNESNIVKPKESCCACGSCQNICPKDAISMQEDDYGFIYPEIDKKLCIGCGMCERVCKYSSTKLLAPIKAYAAVDLNKKELMKSSSGGISAAITRYVVEDGGVAYGAVMEFESGKVDVYHYRVDNLSELVKIQGSKYTQSTIGNIYRKVKTDLEKQLLVVFTGTPCQIAGLKSYLGVDPNNLITIDIVCHGVSNQRIYQDFIKINEERLGDRITSFSFRTKEKGWGIYTGYTTERHPKKRLKHSSEFSYCSYFMKGKFNRINCYSCPYASPNRIGDYTICDFWGVQKAVPQLMNVNGGEFDDYFGISGMLVNSHKGVEFLSKLKGLIKTCEVDPQSIIRYNDQLNAPMELSRRDEVLLQVYARSGYKEIEKDWEKRYGKPKQKLLRAINREKKYIKYMIPIPIRKFISRFHR